jgi:hypothetical protein
MTLVAFATTDCGVVSPAARAAAWFTMTWLLDTVPKGIIAGDSPRITRAASAAACRPLS